MPVTETGCWLWLAGTNSRGYGDFYCGPDLGMQKAHRVSYEIHTGPIPDGMTIDHLCRNKICVNPDHLEAVTSSENTRRSDNPAMQNARKTHCKAGHELSGYNLMIVQGWRQCRACSTARRHVYLAKQRALS